MRQSSEAFYILCEGGIAAVTLYPKAKGAVVSGLDSMCPPCSFAFLLDS